MRISCTNWLNSEFETKHGLCYLVWTFFKLQFCFFFCNSVESLSSKSRVRPAADTFAQSISETALSFQRHYERFLNPSTPIQPGQTAFTFVIPPSVSSELHIPSSELEMEIELQLADGTKPSSSTQVSMINCLPALCWENVFLRINGSPFLPELTYCPHSQYIKIMCTYDERERQALFHSAGEKNV